MSGHGTKAEFQGGAFHPSLPQGRATGALNVSSGGVAFTAGDVTVQLPYTGIVIRRGGAAQRLIFFENAAQPEWSLYTSDADILAHPFLIQRTDVMRQLGGLRRERTVSRLGVAVVLALCLAGLAALYHLKDPMIGVVANRIPVSWEEKLGDTIYNQLIGGRRLLDDEHIVADLDRITAPLVEVLADTPYTFRFHIVDDAAVNAFAIPGGHVVIHSALILTADSPEEIAGVLAHEIAHVTRKHSLRQVISGGGVFLLLQAFFGDITGLLAVIADNGAVLLTRSFSRDYERDADDIGWAHLLDANIDPEGAIRFFEKLKKIEDDMNDGVGPDLRKPLAFLSTHPATSERIARLRKKLDMVPPGRSFRTFNIEFQRFQDSIRSYAADRERSNPDQDHTDDERKD